MYRLRRRVTLVRPIGADRGSVVSGRLVDFRSGAQSHPSRVDGHLGRQSGHADNEHVRGRRPEYGLDLPRPPSAAASAVHPVDDRPQRLQPLVPAAGPDRDGRRRGRFVGSGTFRVKRAAAAERRFAGRTVVVVFAIVFGDGRSDFVARHNDDIIIL